MQKYEYAFVNSATVNGVDRPTSVNGQELPNWKSGPSIYEFCTRMGDEGWELIACEYIPLKLVFKRPKQ